MKAVKRIMKYFKGTIDYGILFSKYDGQRNKFTIFYDLDWCGDKVKEKMQ